MKTLRILLLAVAAQANAVWAQDYYREHIDFQGRSDFSNLTPHGNPVKHVNATSGNGGGTVETVTFSSDPVPYVFATSEAWMGPGGTVTRSNVFASLSYAFLVSGPANDYVPINFRGRYDIYNDHQFTRTSANFAASMYGMDYSRADQIGMVAQCYDNARCFVDSAGWPSANSNIRMTLNSTCFEPSPYLGAGAAGTFEGVMMAPTDASGRGTGTVWLSVEAGSIGVRDDGVSGVSWAFIDPELLSTRPSSQPTRRPR